MWDDESHAPSTQAGDGTPRDDDGVLQLPAYDEWAYTGSDSRPFTSLRQRRLASSAQNNVVASTLIPCTPAAPCSDCMQYPILCAQCRGGRKQTLYFCRCVSGHRDEQDHPTNPLASRGDGGSGGESDCNAESHDGTEAGMLPRGGAQPHVLHGVNLGGPGSHARPAGRRPMKKSTVVPPSEAGAPSPVTVVTPAVAGSPLVSTEASTFNARFTPARKIAKRRPALFTKRPKPRVVKVVSLDVGGGSGAQVVDVCGGSGAQVASVRCTLSAPCRVCADYRGICSDCARLVAFDRARARHLCRYVSGHCEPESRIGSETESGGAAPGHDRQDDGQDAMGEGRTSPDLPSMVISTAPTSCESRCTARRSQDTAAQVSPKHCVLSSAGVSEAIMGGGSGIAVGPVIPMDPQRVSVGECHAEPPADNGDTALCDQTAPVPPFAEFLIGDGAVHLLDSQPAQPIAVSGRREEMLFIGIQMEDQV